MIALGSLPVGGRPTTPPEGRCPSCHSVRLTPVVEQLAVPIHTSALLDSREEAVAYPTADLRLVICCDCGLITNSAFDALGHDYSSNYTEVQTFSPRFREHSSALARTLVERHALEGRDVFEIGPGPADFLLELCALTGGCGWGADPSFAEVRLTGPAADRVSVERAFFAPEQIPEGVALILCRHTLEHVHDVAGFLCDVRAGLERARDAAVVFEVPDTLRILREAAFWDVYYEHCSYFVPGSLARAFRIAGLTPVRLERIFDGQYILITARAGRVEEAVALPNEEGADEIVALATAFAGRVRQAREDWGERLRSTRECGGRAVIWGAGSKGVAFLSMLDRADDVTCAVDVNPAKHGRFLPGTGHQVVAPDRLRDLRPDLVVAMNPSYAAEIRESLEGLGVHASVLAV